MKKPAAFIVLLVICIDLINAQRTSNLRQLTTNLAQEGFATWAPDGKKIAFTSTRSGSFDIWIMDIDIEKINKKFRQINNGYPFKSSAMSIEPVKKK